MLRPEAQLAIVVILGAIVIAHWYTNFLGKE
jgi:hypothetical protein